MNDPVHVVWQMHRNSEFTLIFFGKVMFIFGNTENPTSYAPELKRIPIDRPGKLSESFLFLSVLVCEVVVLLCCVWYRAGVQRERERECVCVCVCVCVRAHAWNSVYIFSTSAKYMSWKKCHGMFGKKIRQVNNAM